MTFIEDTEFTIGGEPILIDKGGKIASFLHDFSPLDIFNEIASPVSLKDGSTDALGGCGGNVSLAVPNWPQMPKLWLNELYWPTGASRFALGCFLLSGASVETLFSDQQPLESTVTLKLDMGHDFTSEMYAIWKRVTGVDDETDLPVYLVFLVDERYFWQFQDAGDMSITEATTWTSLFTSLGGELSTVTADTVGSAYLNPDKESFGRKYANPAILLDAAAASVGQNIVRKFNGVLQSKAWDSVAATVLGDIAVGVWRLLAGGINENPIAPANINVITQGFSGGAVQPNDPREYVKSTGASGPWDQVVRTTAYADYDGTVPSTPDNNTLLDALAAKITEDQVKRYSLQYDVTYVGIQEVKVDPRHDFLLFSIGIPSQFGLKVTTRVKTLPYNSGPSQQLSQDPSLVVVDCSSSVIQPFELTEAFGATTSDVAAAKKTSLAGVLSSDVIEIEANQDIFTAAGASGIRGWAFLSGGTYYCIQLECV